ncbi:LysE/ArgO family amino acid transporter [Aquaspirillum soli]
MLLLPTYFQGMALGAGLIISIGAQGTHVLRVGLQRQHVGITVALCILVDIILIGLGVAGMGLLISENPLLLQLAHWGGALFLLAYGWRAWRACWQGGGSLATYQAAPLNRWQAALTVLTLSLLNPHVYLDTLVVLGAIGGKLPEYAQLSFSLGAMTASLLWFIVLGFGAGYLTRYFQRPLAWRILDAITGCIMWGLALGLIMAAPL